MGCPGFDPSHGLLVPHGDTSEPGSHMDLPETFPSQVIRAYLLDGAFERDGHKTSAW